jgi:predicted RNA-binding Zn-ribbon protein involved in translation (DUF1610 family)
MTNDKVRVMCSHCATRLAIPANSTREQFSCVECGEQTDIQLGVALAQNTTAKASDQAKDGKTRVVCAHCAAKLTLAADSTGTQFKCAKCGERTTRELGAALAGNTTARRSDLPAATQQLRAALIACPVCDKQVSNRAPTCPGCGEPIFRESKVIVYGYTQQFLINPKVQVFWNGALVGSVKKGDSLPFDIDADGEISFSSSVRQASLRVQAGRVTNIKISWDRITGKLIPQIVDVVTPGA